MLVSDLAVVSTYAVALELEGCTSYGVPEHTICFKAILGRSMVRKKMLRDGI